VIAEAIFTEPPADSTRLSGDGKRSVAAWPKLPRPSSRAIVLPWAAGGASAQPARDELAAPQLIELHPVTATGVRSQSRFHDECMLALLQPDSRLHCTSKVSFGFWSCENEI
jgi:hypothetical protein